MPAAPAARTIAVVVGISNYVQKGVEPLQFADKDAKGFYDFLVSRRGRASPDNVTLLLNERATLDGIRTAIRKAFDQAQQGDSVVLFIAAHGIAMDHGPNRGAYILAANSNPENLAATALRMEELQVLTIGPLRARNIRVFVDACHSGIIGSISSRSFNRFATDLLDDHSPVVFGFMASRYKELSYECTNYGHGAFTYFLLRGLNTTDAADRQSGRITMDTLVEFVRDHVRAATNQKQTPEPKGEVPDRIELADLALPGMAGTDGSGVPGPCANSGGRDVQPPVREPGELEAAADPFSVALRRGTILPGADGSAFDIFKRRTDVSSSAWEADRDRLLIALENAGQQIILDYLRGEEVPQTRTEFQLGEQYFTAASSLSPADPFLESRRLFCMGRQMIFDGRYSEAIATLERSAQIFRPGAYSNNAIGIAYLQSADFNRATAAFRDAIQLAPYWAYARHNLALALTQMGDYQEAIRTYQAAAGLVPHYAYIPYNFGLLLERLNRADEAREQWRQSLAISPRMARAWNAIGLSFYLEHRYNSAEDAYRKALDLVGEETDRLAIRHDLALLKAAKGDTDEAIQLWRLNLNEKDSDVPSLIGLSNILIASGQVTAARQPLSVLVQANPSYIGGRLQYAKVLLAANAPGDAVSQLQSVLDAGFRTADVYELLGDARLAMRADSTSIMDAYQQALTLRVARGQQKRVRHKLETVKPH